MIIHKLVTYYRSSECVYITMLNISLTDKQKDGQIKNSQATYGGLSHFLCLNWTPVPQVLLHMLHWLHGLQSPSTCWGIGVLLTHSPALHHWCTHTGKQITHPCHTDHSCCWGAVTVFEWESPTLSAPHSVPSRGGSSLVLQDDSPSTKHQRPAHMRCWNTHRNAKETLNYHVNAAFLNYIWKIYNRWYVCTPVHMEVATKY